MLSKKKIVCPINLLKIAKTKGPVKVVIANAGKAIAMESAKQSVDEGLIEPIFTGDKSIIEKLAKDIKWDISKYEIINEPVENNTALIAAKLASEGKVKIIVKNIKANKKIKSIILSISIVPKSLSTGIFSTWLSEVHLVISPPLGIKRFVKYNTATAETAFGFDDLYPRASIRTIHLKPLFTIAHPPNRIEKKTHL